MNQFNTYYLGALKKYTGWTGRANRREFWYFTLFSFIISIILGWVGQAISSLYSLLVLLPSIAIGMRRLHDIGKSGWYLLLVFVPIIGWLILLYFYIKKGDAGSNAYGAVSTA